MAFQQTAKAALAILLAISLVFETNAQISTPCTSSMISTFTPCLNYVTGSIGTGSSPTQECCNSLKTVMSDSVDCGCLIVTGNVPVSIPFVNRALAISLPRMCQSSVPIQCKASGAPLPAPGPVLFGPTAAPAAPTPHAHSPSSSPSPRPSPKAVAAEPPADESLDTAPASPPEILLGPSSNPGIRPVVNPNSFAPNPATVSLPPLIVMFAGIMAVMF